MQISYWQWKYLINGMKDISESNSMASRFSTVIIIRECRYLIKYIKYLLNQIRYL